MYISSLSLTSYRNFESVKVVLPPGLVVLTGANGQGKSNLLEAVYLLSISKSYRTNAERELVHWSGQRAAMDSVETMTQTIVAAEVEQSDRRLRIVAGLRLAPSESAGGLQVHKQIRVNGVVTSASALVGQMNAVLFTATDVDLVLGSPSGRRRFLDILISQVDRAYLRALQRYQRVLSQRNHLLRLLREGRASVTELTFWDQEMVREGAAIIARRADVIDRLSPLAARAYRALAGGERLAIGYEPSAAADHLEPLIAGQRPHEIRAGVTVAGPHRDDLGLAVDGMPASSYASRGQARTLALALRLAEASFLKEERREGPILLLDDVLSELDLHRRRRVLEEAAGYEQAIVTTAEPALLDSTAVAPAATLTLEGGTVSH